MASARGSVSIGLLRKPKEVAERAVVGDIDAFKEERGSDPCLKRKEIAGRKIKRR